MTVQQAYIFIESLKTETAKKSEIKVYEKFLRILSELKNKEFSNEEIQSIETELRRLDLKSYPENRKKYFKKALGKFEEYLKEAFSLTPKGYYANLYSILGLSFGLPLGIVFLSGFENSLDISLGMIGGMFIGFMIGRHLDSRAVSEGRVL